MNEREAFEDWKRQQDRGWDGWDAWQARAALERSEHPVGSAPDLLSLGQKAHAAYNGSLVLEMQQPSWVQLNISQQLAWMSVADALAATPSRAPASVQDGTGEPPLAGQDYADIYERTPDWDEFAKEVAAQFAEGAAPKAAPAAVSDEQIANMLWSDQFVSYHSTHDPIIQTTSSRMVAFARAILALSSPPSVGEPTRCPYCDDSGDVHGLDGEWRGRCSCPAGTDSVKPAEEPCPHADEPRGCYRVRCQLGRKCVGDDL